MYRDYHHCGGFCFIVVVVVIYLFIYLLFLFCCLFLFVSILGLQPRDKAAMLGVNIIERLLEKFT